MKKRILAFAAVVASVLGGCSFSKQFSEAASPLATAINTSYQGRYVSKWPEGPAKDKEMALSATLQSAAEAGDKPTTVKTWYGDGLRDRYVNAISTDPALAGTPLQVQKNLVRDFDFTLSIGNKTVPATPSK